MSLVANDSCVARARYWGRQRKVMSLKMANFGMMDKRFYEAGMHLNMVKQTTRSSNSL